MEDSSCHRVLCNDAYNSHDFLVPARPFKGPKREAAGGCVEEGDADAPQVHCGPVLLLVVLPQHSSLIHVWMLQHTHTIDFMIFPTTSTQLIRHDLNPNHYTNRKYWAQFINQVVNIV